MLGRSIPNNVLKYTEVFESDSEDISVDDNVEVNSWGGNDGKRDVSCIALASDSGDYKYSGENSNSDVRLDGNEKPLTTENN